MVSKRLVKRAKINPLLLVYQLILTKKCNLLMN